MKERRICDFWTQLKLEELELEHKLQLERSDNRTHDEKETFQPLKGQKLPPFEDSNDSIDAYIQRFEIYAISHKWHKHTWGAHLSALLKGKALNVFARLSPETTLDFGELKMLCWNVLIWPRMAFVGNSVFRNQMELKLLYILYKIGQLPWTIDSGIKD